MDLREFNDRIRKNWANLLIAEKSEDGYVSSDTIIAYFNLDVEKEEVKCLRHNIQVLECLREVSSNRFELVDETRFQERSEGRFDPHENDYDPSLNRGLCDLISIDLPMDHVKINVPIRTKNTTVLYRLECLTCQKCPSFGQSKSICNLRGIQRFITSPACTYINHKKSR